MPSAQSMAPAELVLAVHLAIIGFNLFGLFAVPLGAWRGWSFVREPVWRLVHAASLAVVAVQAALGQLCFLTEWQYALNGLRGGEPLVMRWVNGLVFAAHVGVRRRSDVRCQRSPPHPAIRSTERCRRWSRTGGGGA